MEDTTDNEGTLLEVDSRKRVTLGQMANHRRYLASEDRDGTITLRPAVVMTELEARFLANPDLVKRVEANRSDLSRLVPRTRRSAKA